MIRNIVHLFCQRLFLCGLFGCVLVSGGGYAAIHQEPVGITLHSTRVIYPGAAKGGVSYSLTNDSNLLYLLQARIVPFSVPSTATKTATSLDATTKPEAISSLLPLVVLPPLQRLEPRERVTLRLRAVDETALPRDRESVLTLTLKAIPSEQRADAPFPESEPADAIPSSHAGGSLRLAVQNNLKVFYRPAELPELTALQVSEQLQIRRQGDEIVVKNSTPYYVTFSQLTVGSQAIAGSHLARMVPPFGEQSYPLPAGANGEVRWKTLNDYGATTQEQRRSLSISSNKIG